MNNLKIELALDGKRYGKGIEYYENGVKCYEGDYVDGKPNGDHYYNIQNFMRNNSRSENLQRDFMNYFASNISWR